jgi:hypothetical protein
MNPSSPSVASRPNTSTAIKNAHAALTEKARESTYITNPPPKRIEGSPERSLIRGAAHKRMQSLQTGSNVRDLSSFLEGGSNYGSSPASPEKHTRPPTPHGAKDFFSEAAKLPEISPDKDVVRSTTPTPSQKTPTKENLAVRPSLRRPPQSILGENTPPQSATMLALQNMASKDVDGVLGNVTNGSTALVRTPQTFDAISNQILSLTSIATSLQREMAQLSRRSKDNATDLVSLKEATNARDEDIRKSLRELVSNLSESSSRASSLMYPNGGLYLDSKAYNSPASKHSKQFSLPRIPSPNSFAASMDRDSVASPCPFAPDGAANIALLEKVLREMGTKDGQENLISRLTEIGDNLSKDGVMTAKKLEEVLQFIKRNTPQAVVQQNSGGTGANRPRNFSFDNPPVLELDFDQPRSGPMTSRVEALLAQGGNKENMRSPTTHRASDIVNEDLMKVIRTIKDSVAQGGGLTAEVKALVRELRGEVLGMGREIGRKLEESSNQEATSRDPAVEKEEIAQVVHNGLQGLKEHLDHLMEENHRQSASSMVHQNPVDYQEIYNAVRAAMNEKPRESRPPDLGREEIIEAVREAWENYKPDIELQHFGLERDELLACLKEGMQEYAPQDNARDVGGATREEVFTAVVEGLKHFSPPRAESEASLSREEILDAVRECLEEFEFPAAPAPEPRHAEHTREDMLEAVKEGLDTFDFTANAAALSRDFSGSATREDMLEAVKEGLHTFDFASNTTTLIQTPTPGLTREDVLDAAAEALHNFDFPSTAPDVRDVDSSVTREDVLDAINEGLHTFDFAEHAPTQEAILQAVKEGLETFEFPAKTSTREDVLDAVKEGLLIFDFPTNDAGIGRQEILDAIKEGLNNSDFGANSMALSRNVVSETETLNRDDVYDAVKAGLREVPLNIDPFGTQVLERLQEVLESMHTEFKAVSDEAKQNVSAHGRDTEQVLDATKDGFEKLRTDIESYVDRGADVTGKEEILDSISENFTSLRTDFQALLSQKSDTSMEAIQGELEHLRETMALSLVRGGSNIDRDEILDALKDGLEGLRADMDRPRDTGNESVLSSTGEILDALHDGLTGLRADIEKVHNKPVDMTVNYEILDTLKAGLEGVRGDIDRLRESGFGENAVAEVSNHALIAAAESGLKRNDIENLEVLITQLRIKVESLESMSPQPTEPPVGSLSKEDLTQLEEKLASLQDAVLELMNRDSTPDESTMKREDMEAIETLLRNTKAKIDDIDPEQTVKKEHLDVVEALLFETKESVGELKIHLEDVTKQDDISMVEGLLRGVVEGLDELKEKLAADAEDLEKVTKTDIDAVEAVCLDVKAAIEERVLPEFGDLASKGDIKLLGDLVKEFNGRIELHADSNAKSFEERQAETVGVGERVSEVKAFLEEFRESIREKMEEDATSVETLGKFLESLGETIGQNANVTEDVKDLCEMVKVEFEKSNAGVVGSKLEADEKFQMTWDKFDAKLEEKFTELMNKYNNAELAADAKAKAGDEKNAEIEAAMLGTKAVADDLKLLVDTLGVTLTDSVEKMDEASKTVFSRVEDTFTRVEETHADAKAEHQLTREQVFKSIGAIEGVQGHVTEYHPKILDSIKDVLLIVGEHYEHSKTASTTLQEKISEIPPPPPPFEMPLLPPPVEKYDDTPVHEKLDKLVDHIDVAGKSFAQLEMLDKIHQQVMQTAAEVSNFVAAQTQRIADDHEDKEKAVEAATIALEKQLAQMEQVEASVVGLREEQEQLKQSVSILKTEQSDLSREKMRLSADVSSLETALRIRREELHTMEARAEALERRILEGVIDHSRALLLSKGNKGTDSMSRKRVASHATSNTGSIASTGTRASSRNSYASNTTQSAINMAMNGKRALMSVPINNSPGGARRILSLNQISHNVPTGAIQRSHSVKQPGGAGALRKSSWGGTLSQKYGDLNKENLALKESEEDDEVSDAGQQSDGECDRRTSQGTTILTTTGTGVSESVIDEGTEWTGSMDGDTESHVSDETMEDPAEVVLYDEAAEVA